MGLMVQATEDERISTIARQMGKWVDQILGKGFHCPHEAWTPAVNFYESENEYVVVVELAGVDPQKVDLHVERESLVISGQRPTPGLPAGCRAVNMVMMEIDHGPFCRSLKLPIDADVDEITASYRGGYLWVRIPRKA